VLLRLLRRRLLALEDATEWHVERRDWWCYVRRRGAEKPSQGWKLHLSATILSAPAVLDACLPILLASQVSFKFASSLKIVAVLNHSHFPREHSGKAITVYPRHVQEARYLAQRLDAATRHLVGPRILSDIRMRNDSLVHARFGSFGGPISVSPEGWIISELVLPSGDVVEDERLPYSNVPEWVRDSPFDREPLPADRTEIRLAGRYLITSAIRHSNKGGVYRGVDTTTGRQVVVKEARRHVHVDRYGRDATDRLRHEHQVLQALQSVAACPDAVELLWQGEHLYLVREYVRGRTLAAARATAMGTENATPLAAAIMNAVRQLHDRGWVVRDLSPGNVLLTAAGPVLIDLELAWHVGGESRPYAGATAPYAAPEQLTRTRPAFAADVFSLGAMLCFIVTGLEPRWLEGDDRDFGAGLSDWLDRFPPACGLTPIMRATIEACMELEPAKRITLDEAVGLLTEAGPRRVRTGSATPSGSPVASFSRTLADTHLTSIVDSLIRTADWSSADCVWPVAWEARAADPCSVQHGVAGVAMTMVTCRGAVDERRVEATLSRAAGWLRAAVGDRRRLTSGLYMGMPGVACTMHELGRLLDDRLLLHDARQLLLRVPTEGSHVDVMFGTAGLGLACLYMARHEDDGTLIDRAVQCASQLRRQRTERDGEIWWEAPPIGSLTSRTAWFGFAHGTAGIGTFLLACQAVTRDDEWLRLATGAGRWLAAAAQRRAGPVYWPRSPRSDVPWSHWCHGSSGVGTFLIRLHAARPEDTWRDLSEGAGIATIRDRPRASSCQCHGLAGDGEYLLDLWEATGEAEYRREAESHAAAIMARSARRSGVLVHPDDRHDDTSSGYGTGSAGVASFLARLLDGGRRLWL
jgi:hypothetical protein